MIDPSLAQSGSLREIIGLNVGTGCGTPQPVCALGSTAAARADGTGCPPPQRKGVVGGEISRTGHPGPCYLALAPTASASRRLGGTQAATRDTAPRSPSSLKRGAPRPQRVTQHHVPRLHTSRAELSLRRVPRAPRPRHRKRLRHVRSGRQGSDSMHIRYSFTLNEQPSQIPIYRCL